MFQLQISDLDATSGSIPVSWCLDAETIKEMADKKATKPFVVICVAPTAVENADGTRINTYHIKKEYRKVVPLKDLMTYVEFRSSGPNKIWGFISYMKKGEAYTRYLGKKDGEFQTNILDYDGEDYSHWLLDTERGNPVFKNLSQPISVEVPAGVFAPEPAQWEKTWVNYFFKDKVVDQCEFRRRRLFAYGVQPLIMFGNLFLRLLFLVAATLVLAKAWSLKWLFHPLTYSLDNCLDIFSKGSIVIFHQPEDDITSGSFPKPSYFIRSFWLFWVLPLFWLPIAIFVLLGSFLGPAIWSGIVLGLLTVFMLIATCIHYFKALGILKRPFTWLWEFLTQEQGDGRLWYLNQKEMNYITCTQDRKPLNFKRLPSGHKTIRLRFQDLKSKVCKPFSF